MEGGGGIERLADDLLSLIASHLSLEEAARACVLSSRWDKLWNAIPCLSFVSPRYPDDINDCSKYVQKVKRVLERRGGALPPAAAFTLNSLEFGHLLDRTHMQLVEDWFRYAMAHKVENLILDLRIDDPGEALETPPPAAALTNLKWLKTLKLKRVNLTKEFVELVLSNCRLLEKLVVVPNEQLPGLRISGSSLLLRHLKIGGYWFHEFELISLCAPNLTSFNYYGPRLILGTLDVPRLLSLSLGGGAEIMYRPIADNLHPFRKYLPQLVKLKLRYSPEIQSLMTCKRLPSLLKLRQLKLTVSQRRAGHEFKGLIGLMKKCPRLQMLKIHAMLWNSPCPKLTLDHLNENRVKLISRRPHFQCLREVRIDGATWRTLDLQLTANIIERSPKLEKLTVRTRSPREVVFLNMEKMADILRKRVPAGCPAAIIVEE